MGFLISSFPSKKCSIPLPSIRSQTPYIDINAKYLNDLMNRELETISPDLPLQDLIEEHLLKKRERAFLVFEKGRLGGTICLDDV
jgi:hypothetical protein